MMDEEENEMIYEDDVIEVVSLNDEDEQNQLQAGLINMDIGDGDDGDIDDSGDGDDGPSFQPLRDDAIACLTEHKGPVFTVCSSNTCSYIASGGQDDRAIVWRSSDYQMLFECTGHHDSVTYLSFSCDDKYLATSDMSGLIQVWSLANGKVIWSFEIGPVEWLLWHHQAHVLLAGDNGGDGWVWLIPSGACKTLPSHGCGNMAASLQPDGTTPLVHYDITFLIKGREYIADMKMVQLSYGT
jgi:ribosome assembly protein SQT1